LGSWSQTNKTTIKLLESRHKQTLKALAETWNDERIRNDVIFSWRSLETLEHKYSSEISFRRG
ncbi:hypothetical protein AMECASPLE_036260, partial [Ameca splendens]